MDILKFFAKCGVKPTPFQVKNFATACLASGFDNIKDAHDMMSHIVSNPNPEPKFADVPPGGRCPECKHKIVIGQDLKKRCNCRIW
jgi:hypothetical protein